MSTILCNFALENLAENPNSYDRKIAIPYRAGTIPSSVVQFHLREPRVGSAVKPNRLVVFKVGSKNSHLRKTIHYCE